MKKTYNGYEKFDSVFMASYICPTCGHVHFPNKDGVYQCANCNCLFEAHTQCHEVMTSTDNYHNEFEMFCKACDEVKSDVPITISHGYAVPLKRGGFAISSFSATQDTVDVERFVKALPKSLRREFVAFGQYRKLPAFEKFSQTAMRAMLRNQSICNRFEKFRKDFYNWFYYKFGGAIIGTASLVGVILSDDTPLMWICGIICIAAILGLIVPLSIMYIKNAVD